MRVITDGVMIDVAEFRREGRMMRRVAYGQVAALTAYDALQAAGAKVVGTATFEQYGRHVCGFTADDRAFVYEEEGSFASSLYVEQA